MRRLLVTFKKNNITSRHYFILLFGILFTNLINAQENKRQHYNDNVYVPPAPGDPNYRTYVFNNRRYGQAFPNDPYSYNPQLGGGFIDGAYTKLSPAGQPVPGSVLESYRLPNGIRLPGVLGGWRPDLQGKMRPDSLNLERDVFVSAPVGQIQGFKVYLYDNPDPHSGYRPGLTPVERIMGNVSVFVGIPYAVAPVGEGRFKPPRPHPGFQLVQAVDFGPACPQPPEFTGATKGVRDMDEDCLYLNIYSPTTKGGLAQPFPVMFYIHGGDFYSGASNLFPGHVMAAFYGVIVVTFNYRLGALGFLSTGDANSPGNYGILDQAMALRWVYDNIQSFNGDRDQITLFGPGAGAASAGLLMINPRTRQYVRRVIAQSGSVLSDWALIIDKYRAQNTSRVFAQHLGCSIENSYKLVDCLKRARSFFEIGGAKFQPQVGLFPWGPVYDVNFTVPGDNWYDGWREKDWHLINALPEEQIKRGEFNRGLSYMTGVTTQEAAHHVYNNASLGPYYELDEKFFDEQIRALVLRYNYTLNMDGIYRAIKYMYTYWPDPNNKTHIREQFINMLSDFLYRAPTDKMVKLLVDQGVPVYMYVMNTTVESLHFPEWRKYSHNIEHLFLTGAPFMDAEYFPAKPHLERTMWTNNDRNMSHFFMKAFTDFAKYGNPTHTQILGLHFEKAETGQLKYLNLNTTYNSSILMNYRQTESAFWTWYLPTVVGILVPTYPPSTEFWWEPKEPLQIAFWSVSTMCLLLIVVVVICCILWRNAKREIYSC
ncbi:carboxyl ester lipase-like protein Gli isoform X2 [Lycorma delicatula]|uniref:carboxyl ester lipase-like protein Gli isoform X2 n=1 Tax=Lycorma delicatula TaxID=130591 RepID=UPI003F50DF04